MDKTYRRDAIYGICEILSKNVRNIFSINFRKLFTKRNILRLSILLILVFITFSIAYHYTHVALKNANFTHLKKIKISGNTHLSTSFLQTIATPFINESIYDIDLQDVTLRYSAISRIKDVKAKTVFPHTLKITVSERKGLFYIKDTTGEYYPIDDEMIVLDKADWYTSEDLPLINYPLPKDTIIKGNKIENKHITDIYNVYEQMKNSNHDILAEISEFYFKNSDIHFIDSISGCRVIINPQNIATQISRFIFIRNNQAIDKNSTVDLRFETHVIIS